MFANGFSVYLVMGRLMGRSFWPRFLHWNWSWHGIFRTQIKVRCSNFQLGAFIPDKVLHPNQGITLNFDQTIFIRSLFYFYSNHTRKLVASCTSFSSCHLWLGHQWGNQSLTIYGLGYILGKFSVSTCNLLSLSAFMIKSMLSKLKAKYHTVVPSPMELCFTLLASSHC